MSSYKSLNNQIFSISDYSFVPIRHKDRYLIMKWRNEQIYHLRQKKLLTKEIQDTYFSDIVHPLFDQENPDQLLFSYLKNEVCIGYGGLVHINWIDSNAELSFLIDTKLEVNEFEIHYTNYLKFINHLIFHELSIHKVYSYAFDLRPNLYKLFENNGFSFEARLSEHILFEGKFIDIVIHSLINNKPKNIKI
jgi:RimJ/RimL family protein N-acetyltransferase